MMARELNLLYSLFIPPIIVWMMKLTTTGIISSNLSPGESDMVIYGLFRVPNSSTYISKSLEVSRNRSTCYGLWVERNENIIPLNNPVIIDSHWPSQTNHLTSTERHFSRKWRIKLNFGQWHWSRGWITDKPDFLRSLSAVEVEREGGVELVTLPKYSLCKFTYLLSRNVLRIMFFWIVSTFISEVPQVTTTVLI